MKGEGTEHHPETFSRWLILAIIYLCMLSYALVLQSIPPVLTLIMDQLHLSYYQAGVLMSLFALPGILVSLPAGMLGDHYGVRRVGIVSFAVTIAGELIVATGQTFASLAIGRIAAGAGATSLMIIAPQGIAQWFKSREIGKAMGVYNTALPLGVITSLNVLPALASRWGWRSAPWAAAAFSATALGIFCLGFQENKSGTRRATYRAPKFGGEDVLVSLVAISWALFSACIVSLYTFVPDFMVERGLSLKSAGFVTSLVVAGPLCLSPVIGYAVDRMGHAEAFIAAGGVGMAFLLPCIPFTETRLVLLIVLVGIGAALIPAPIYSLTADVVSQKRFGFGFGVLSMLNNTGVFVGPQLVGLSRDVSGSYTLGFVLMALFVVLSAVIAAIVSAKRARQRYSF